MDDRSVIGDHSSGNAMATFSLVAVIVVVGLIALFVWQPWNVTTEMQSATTIAQPGISGTTHDGSGTSTTSGKSH
jgi:hypothetical protein